MRAEQAATDSPLDRGHGSVLHTCTLRPSSVAASGAQTHAQPPPGLQTLTQSLLRPTLWLPAALWRAEHVRLASERRRQNWRLEQAGELFERQRRLVARGRGPRRSLGIAVTLRRASELCACSSQADGLLITTARTGDARVVSAE